MFVIDALDGDGHLFWECMFPRPIHLPHRPEFLMAKDRSHLPRCLLWHDLLPGLSSRTGDASWAVAAADLAVNELECALGDNALQPGCA